MQGDSGKFSSPHFIYPRSSSHVQLLFIYLPTCPSLWSRHSAKTDSTFNLPLHASSAGSTSSANTLFSSGRPLIHAALALSPDLALYFWILLLLIHASLHLRNDKLSRFSPSQESSFCNTCNFVGSLCHCTLFFFFFISRPLLSRVLPDVG